MKTSAKFFLFMAVICFFVPSISFGSGKILTIATTTSLENSGLLDYLNQKFTEKTKIIVRAIAKGSGAAIEMAKNGDADLIITHDEKRERQFVEEGYGEERRELMYNDYILIGPKNDPARIFGMRDVSLAFAKIAKDGKVRFVSRGDDSGTHTCEQELWRSANVPLIKVASELFGKSERVKIKYEQPMGSWYLSVGQGMGKAFTIAYEKGAYLFIDRGTYLALMDKYPMRIMVEGDEKLKNKYAVVVVSPAKFAHVKYAHARRYADWLFSDEGKSLISDFKVKEHRLFIPY